MREALRAFARGGYDGVNLRDIAAAAEVNVSLIIHRWGSKLELWRAVVDHVGEVFGVAIRSAIELTPGGTAVQRLRWALRGVVDTTCDIPERGLLLIQDIASPGERLDYVYDRLMKPAHDLLLPLIHAVSEEQGSQSTISGIDRELLTFVLAGAVATGVAMRPLMARFTDVAADDDAFRVHLGAAVSGAFLSAQEFDSTTSATRRKGRSPSRPRGSSPPQR
jgi:AcrR family transcriptional regulator